MKHFFYLLVSFISTIGSAQFTISSAVPIRSSNQIMEDNDVTNYLRKVNDAGRVVTAAERQYERTFVGGLKDSSLWGSGIALYQTNWGNANANKFNLLSPYDTDASYRLVFSGGLSHTSSGIDPNGSTGKATTYFNPFSMASSNYLAIGCYITENTAAGSKEEIGANDGGPDFGVLARFSGDLFYPGVGSGSFPSVSITDARGLTFSNRVSTNAANVEGYKNGIRVVNGAQTAGRPNAVVKFGCRGTTGTDDRFSDRTASMLFIWSGMSSTQMRALNNISERLMDDYGIGVQ